MAASLLEASDKHLEEDAQDFIQDKEKPRDPFPLYGTQEPLKPPHCAQTPSFRFEIRFSK